VAVSENKRLGEPGKTRTCNPLIGQQGAKYKGFQAVSPRLAMVRRLFWAWLLPVGGMSTYIPDSC
jgi:hypothetical protein